MNAEDAKLLDELRQVSDDVSLDELIELNLTRLNDEFDDRLREQIVQSETAGAERAVRLRAIRSASRSRAQAGNYRRAQFNEAQPGNVKEILLAQARRIERGELDLAAAVEETIGQLSDKAVMDIYACWEDLTRSIERNTAMADYLALGELIYRVGRQLPKYYFDFYFYGAAFNTNQTVARRFIEQERYEEAAERYERLAAIAEENDNSDLLCRALLSLGDLWRDRLLPPAYPDHLERAARCHTRALQICEDGLIDAQLRADALFQLGVTGLEKKDYVAATGHLRELLIMARDRDVEIVLSRLETVAAMLSHIAYTIGDEVAEAISAAVRLAESMEADTAAHKFRSTVYAALGIYHKQAWNPQQALDAYEIAIAEAEAGGDEIAAARWLDNKRHLYMMLNEWDAAAAIAKRTSRIYVTLKDYQGAANQLLDEGHREMFYGKPAPAAFYWALAYTLFHQIGRVHGMGYAVLNLSRVYRAFGDLSKAENCLRHCLSIAEAQGAERMKCYAMSELAALQAALGETEKAIVTYTEAIALAEELGEMGELDFRLRRGRILEMIGQTQAAIDDYRGVMALQEIARGDLRAFIHRVQAQRRSEEATTRLLRLLAQQPEDQNAIREAFAVAERARSRTLAELLSRRHLRQPASLPSELALRERELLAQLLRMEETEDSKPDSARQYAQLTEDLNKIWQEMAEIDEPCRDYVDLRRIPIVKPNEIARLLVAEP